jgi:pantothenate kinase-related protein Tda10
MIVLSFIYLPYIIEIYRLSCLPQFTTGSLKINIKGNMTIQKQIETLKEKLFDINVYTLKYVSLLDEIIVLQYQLNSEEFNCNYYYKCSAEAKHKARCLADDCYDEAFGEELVYNYHGIAI